LRYFDVVDLTGTAEEVADGEALLDVLAI